MLHVPNITLAVPDAVLRAARIRAAEQGTSVSAMVRQFLVSVAEPDEEFRRLEHLQEEVLAELGAFSGQDRLARDEVHGRALR